MMRGAIAVVAIAVAALAAAQAPDRSRPPALDRPPSLRLPAVEKRVLSNGIPVWIVPLHEVPVVAVTLVVRSGSGADPAGKFGLASLTAAMLDEGAGGRSALALADAVDFLGASLATSSTFDASAIRLRVPVARLRDALPLMADVVRRPRFPEAELERVRKERLTALLQARDDPTAIVAAAFPRLLYGPTHRYGTGTSGTPDTVRALRVEDLRRFYTARYRPENVALIVVGDVDVASGLPLLESAFGSWKVSGDSGAGSAALPPAPQPAARQIFLVDKPGAAQSQIRIGWIGVPRSTPDFFVLQVLNTVLGGSFTSRLNQNLREQHGYTYGARSIFDMRASAGPFFATAGVQTDKTAEALTEFFNELNRIDEPVPSAELARAKNYLALGFPSEFETSTDISRRLEELVVYNLPSDSFATYVEQIQAVASDDVRRAGERYIQPDKFVVVIVGDAAIVEASIRTLSLGPLKVLSVTEVMGSD